MITLIRTTGQWCKGVVHYVRQAKTLIPLDDHLMRTMNLTLPARLHIKHVQNILSVFAEMNGEKVPYRDPDVNRVALNFSCNFISLLLIRWIR